VWCGGVQIIEDKNIFISWTGGGLGRLTDAGTAGG